MSFRPGAWRAQAGFSPTGLVTPAQRLQKSMSVGSLSPDKGLKPLPIKVGFAVSQYSGPMNPGSMKYESGAPPFTMQPLRVQKKEAAPTTPAGRLSASKAVGLPKTTPPPGPSIAQIAKPKGIGTPLPGTTKTALLERLVRLGATPIPNTPKLFMKLRTPAELGALQHSVDAGWQRHVTAPLEKKLQPLAQKVQGKLRPAADYAARELSKDPIGAAYTIAGPGGAAYPVLKRGLEKAIDRTFPLKA